MSAAIFLSPQSKVVCVYVVVCGCVWLCVYVSFIQSRWTFSLSSSSLYHEPCSHVFSKANDRFRSALRKKSTSTKNQDFGSMASLCWEGYCMPRGHFQTRELFEQPERVRLGETRCD